MINIEDYAKLAPQFYDQQIPYLLKKYLKSSKFESLLDCGCGDGALLHRLKSEGYLKSKKVFAIDLSKSRINLVRKIDSKFNAAVDNAEKMKSIRDNSIDLFISTQVIEHVNDKKMVNAIDRVTRSNATIYLSTIFKKWWGWYFYRNKGKWVLDPTHLREYQRDHDLLKLFPKKKYVLLENQKKQQWFSLGGFLLPRLRLRNRDISENKLASLLKKIKVPIPGYYTWEIVLRKTAF